MRSVFPVEGVPVDLRFRQLECFLVLAETLNFGRAANQLHTSQPALSFQIKAMEAEVGSELFQRDKRHVSLTEAGTKLVSSAKTILKEVRAYEENIRSISGSRKLRVFCGPAGEQYFLPATLRALSKRAPDWNVELCDMQPIEHTSALRENRADLLLMVRRIEGPGVTFLPISDEPWYAVVPKDSPVAKRGKISLAEFCREPIVVTGRRYSDKVASQLQELLLPFDADPTFLEAPPSPSARFAMVAAGQGYSFCTGLLAPSPDVPVVAIPFEESLPPLQRGVAWRTNFDPTSLTLIKQALSEVVEASPNPKNSYFIRPDASLALAS
jgi:DNA-binding transcriptional LysR family regulator